MVSIDRGYVYNDIGVWKRHWI